jgi:hypothetical protein
MTRRVTIEEVKLRLLAAHGDNVVIDESTYVSADKRA